VDLVNEAAAPILCRDCLASSVENADRCTECGSPRIVSHPELHALSIAHVDCDAFYAAVEKRDNPSLADRPVIVGGGKRGVVSTACYVARTFGVRSAMPMFKALEACPHAVVIPPDMAKYVRVGREVRDLMLSLTPAVEPLSIDEAFLDLTGTQRVHKATPALTLARFQKRVEDDIGVTVSIGLSHNKFLAKIASDLDKPRGFAAIGRAETVAFLGNLPVSVIWGVGKKMQERLSRDGLNRIADLQTLNEKSLAKRYGSIGFRLARLSRGEDVRTVVPERSAKGISAETTFDTDLASATELVPILRRLSERVSGRLKREGLAGRTIVLKLKTSEFRLRTRNERLDQPTDLADRIYRVGRSLLLKELDGTSFRLIGIGVADLAAAGLVEPKDLIDEDAEKRAKAERAMDNIRGRFGRDGLSLGLTFLPKPPTGRRSA
jgi:DNA polymerase IV